MANIFYAKVNVNSDIYKVYSKEISLNDVLAKLYLSINDKVEYKKVFSWYSNDSNRKILKDKQETYCFSDLNKVVEGNKKFIYGKIVRRFPLHTEKFDTNRRKSEEFVIDDNSMSINFYFDLDTEIVGFYIRKSFKQIQFVEAFKELINRCVETVDFEVFLLADPFTMKERLEKVYMITRLKATVVPPNANEEALKSLYDRNVKGMHEANVTKKTDIFEVAKNSKKGINIKADMIEETIDSNEAFKMFQQGYGKIEVDGKNIDGSRIHFDSEEDSPYITILDDSMKNNINEFINACKSGISAYITKKTVNKYLKK